MATRRKFEISDEKYEAELRRAKVAPRTGLNSVEYDRAHRQLVLFFAQGGSIGLPLADVSELSGATSKDLQSLYLTPSGDTIVAERLDRFINVEALMNGFAAKNLAKAVARVFGAAGGARTSERKKAAAVANGIKGGRPKKEIAHAAASPADKSARNR
ncbi:DUF2442 domain-containing protein [Caenimonas sp. SL110]|uniref:DUF2442 domain-containing protein n=1 Tax=Caenimonas sp. SL110 TaxID=1450524 RepID=UPI00069DA26E|nr:DUF2442 domain-containing protein [Caenimonas sp. SL110]